MYIYIYTYISMVISVIVMGIHDGDALDDYGVLAISDHDTNGDTNIISSKLMTLLLPRFSSIPLSLWTHVLSITQPHVWTYLDIRTTVQKAFTSMHYDPMSIAKAMRSPFLRRSEPPSAKPQINYKHKKSKGTKSYKIQELARTESQEPNMNQLKKMSTVSSFKSCTLVGHEVNMSAWTWVKLVNGGFPKIVVLRIIG